MQPQATTRRRLIRIAGLGLAGLGAADSPVLLGTVYDPTFGDDTRDFLGIDPALARANHRQVNAIIAKLASRYGTLVDPHAHFLTGDPSWFTRTIEPSLRGASEVRRVFLQPALQSQGWK